MLALYFLLFCSVNKSGENRLIQDLLTKTNFYPEHWCHTEEQRSHNLILQELKQKPHFLFALHGMLSHLQKYAQQHHLNLEKEKFSDGSNLLHFATIGNNFNTIKWLVEHKVAINEPNTKGYVPLFFVFRNRSLKSLRYLIDAGADLHQPMTLYSLKHLPEKVLDGTTRLFDTNAAHWSAHFGWHEAIELLFEYHISFDRQDSDNAPLTLAAINLDYKTVHRLLKHKTPIENFSYSSPNDFFHIATWRINGKTDNSILPTIKTLILFGATQRDVDQDTNLVITCPDLFEVTTANKLCIKNTAACDIRDELGVTPLHYACGQGATTLVGKLRKKGANLFNADNMGLRTIDLVNIILKRNNFTNPAEKQQYQEIYNYLTFYYRLKNSVLAKLDMHTPQHKSLMLLEFEQERKFPLLPHDIIKQINYFIEH